MPKISRRLFAATVALLAGVSAGTAGAGEIKVLCSGASFQARDTGTEAAQPPALRSSPIWPTPIWPTAGDG
jgi:hypothetical protein